MFDGGVAQTLVLVVLVVLLLAAGAALLRAKAPEVVGSAAWRPEMRRLNERTAAMDMRIGMLPQPSDFRAVTERLVRLEEQVRGVGDSALKTEGMVRMLLEDRLRRERQEHDRDEDPSPREERR
jgi:hypothetical protein